MVAWALVPTEHLAVGGVPCHRMQASRKALANAQRHARQFRNLNRRNALLAAPARLRSARAVHGADRRQTVRRHAP